jgi:hypothetical protein
MKRTLSAITLALAALALTAAGPGIGAAPGKTTICHFTGKKYIAITVSKKAVAQHQLHHTDIVDPLIVPQNNRGLARTFCSSLPVLTPTRGGKKVSTNLTAAGLTANLGLRLRVGQGQVCYSLTVTKTPPGALTITSAALTSTSAPTVTLDFSGLTTTGASPLTLTKCQPLARTTVKALMKNKSGYTATIQTSAGNLTGALGS